MVETIKSTTQQQQLQQHRKRWILPLLASLLFSSLLLSASLFSTSPWFLLRATTTTDKSVGSRPVFVETRLGASPTFSNAVPRLAYLISGSRGDGESLKRTLMALYHPNNFYVVHLDLEASPEERLQLAALVRDHPIFAAFGNVRVIARSNLVTYRGPTMVANTLHAASILLKEGGDWDWFINLSASDYPLVTQDDILSVLASLPRHLNFLEHTSDIGWKEFQRARPVIIDPGLYRLQKSDVFWITEKRSLPTAYKLFTGSAWMMLSHQFIEYCLWGWDNLPRTVLMYYANFLSSPEGYFHTVICNSDEFRTTTVNHDLHFISWDNPPKQHPHFLNLADFPQMVNSNAPFARKFSQDEPALDQIDKELLGREPGGFARGGWLVGGSVNTTTFQFKTVKSASDLRPGPGAERFKNLTSSLLSGTGPGSQQCV